MAAPGINVLMKLQGGEQLKKQLRKLEPRFLAELANTLPQEGQSLMASANASAPKASGQLASSTSVTAVVQHQKGRVKVAAAYLDEKAAAVHEGVHWGAHIAGTRGFKWYERAFNAFEAGVIERIGARLRRLIGGGT